MAELITGEGTILDVGGSLKELKRFVSNHITTTDVIGGDIISAGTHLPFKDKSFDLVVSLDTIEHIPAKNRLLFLAEVIRVAKKQVIIAAPMGTIAHQQAEKGLAKLHPKDRYLQEHIQYGLPTLADIKTWVKDLPQHELSFADDWRLAALMFKLHRFEINQPQLNRLIYYGKLLINWLANTLIFPFTKDVAYTQTVNRWFLKFSL
jgi:ubiquinone/menaquinone biosynthesis C-methylase UbiE